MVKIAPFRNGKNKGDTPGDELLDLRRDDAYRTIDDELRAFDDKVAELKRRERRLVDAIAADEAKTEHLRNDGVLGRARALLNRESANEEAAGITRQKLASIRDEMETLKRGIERLQAERDKARNKASCAICSQLQPEHTRLVVELVNALDAAAAALEAERVFRVRLGDHGIAWQAFLQQPHYPFELAELLDRRDSESPINRLKRSTIETGPLKARRGAA